MQTQTQPEGHKAPFQLTFKMPFSTFQGDGTATPTPYLVDGLLTAGGLSVLGAKPKAGKSSLSRYLAVAVAKGTPFLGRETKRGEVVLCSLEDPLSHVDNCLGALGYDPKSDAKIQIVERVSSDLNESIKAIRTALVTMPDTRLVVIDHLAKLLRLPDLSDYMPTLQGIGLLHDLARAFPHVHVLCLAHSKKVRCEDPFDGILGSTALRGEPDTNLVILNERDCRVIVTETRIGRAIPATVLSADVVESAGSNVVQGYSLGQPFDQWEDDQKESLAEKQSAMYAGRITDYLAGCEGQTALQSEVLKAVTGKTHHLLKAIKALESDGVLSAGGSPKTLTLEMSGVSLKLYQMGRKQ